MNGKKQVRTSISLWLVLLLCYGAAFGQYSLDVSFATAGHRLMSADTVHTVVHGLRLPGDSLLVLSQVGPVSATEFDRDVLLGKYDRDGNLDSSFGQGGLLRFDFDTLSYSTGIYLLEDIDGSFLVLGSGKANSNAARTWGCLQRVSRNGKLLPLSPDVSALQYEVLALEEYPNVIHRDAGNRYVIAGSTFDPIGNHPQPILIRYTADWRLDSSFGGMGQVIFDLGATYPVRTGAVHFSGGFIRDLIPQADSGFVICGALSNGDYYEGFIAGISENGSLDDAFCPPLGYASFDLFDGYDTRLQGLEQMADGTFLFGGSAHPTHPDPDVLLGRLNPANGSFSYEKVDLGASQDEFEDMLLLPGGELVVLATRKSASAEVLALIEVPQPEFMENHLVATFSPDTSFSVAGNCLLAQSDRVLMGGYQRIMGARIAGLLTAARPAPTSVSDDLSESIHISIFPNPAHEHLNIRSSEFIRELSLHALDGTLVFAEKAKLGTEMRLELPAFGAGVYVLTVNQRIRKKIIVK